MRATNTFQALCLGATLGLTGCVSVQHDPTTAATSRTRTTATTTYDYGPPRRPALPPRRLRPRLRRDHRRLHRGRPPEHLVPRRLVLPPPRAATGSAATACAAAAGAARTGRTCRSACARATATTAATHDDRWDGRDERREDRHERVATSATTSATSARRSARARRAAPRASATSARSSTTSGSSSARRLATSASTRGATSARSARRSGTSASSSGTRCATSAPSAGGARGAQGERHEQRVERTGPSAHEQRARGSARRQAGEPQGAATTPGRPSSGAESREGARALPAAHRAQRPLVRRPTSITRRILPMLPSDVPVRSQNSMRLPGARLHVHDHVGDHREIARRVHALVGLVGRVVGVVAPHLVVPDDLPELALAVVGEGVHRLHRVDVDVDVLVLVGMVRARRREADLDRVAQVPAVVGEREPVGAEVVVLLVRVRLHLGVGRRDQVHLAEARPVVLGHHAVEAEQVVEGEVRARDGVGALRRRDAAHAPQRRHVHPGVVVLRGRLRAERRLVAVGHQHDAARVEGRVHRGARGLVALLVAEHVALGVRELRLGAEREPVAVAGALVVEGQLFAAVPVGVVEARVRGAGLPSAARSSRRPSRPPADRPCSRSCRSGRAGRR